MSRPMHKLPDVTVASKIIYTHKFWGTITVREEMSLNYILRSVGSLCRVSAGDPVPMYRYSDANPYGDAEYFVYADMEGIDRCVQILADGIREKWPVLDRSDLRSVSDMCCYLVRLPIT